MITNVPGAAGTTAQQRLVYQGQRAVIAAPILAFASLANGQTFATITPALAADSRTINAALALATDRPTFCVALAAELNSAGTTAYVWTVNGAGDGLVGTAKTPGIAANYKPTGTALVGGVGAISTVGFDPISSQGNKLESLASGGWQDTVSKIFDRYSSPNTSDWGYIKPGGYPLGLGAFPGGALPSGLTDPQLAGAPIRQLSSQAYWSSCIIPPNGVRVQPWAVAYDVTSAGIFPANGELTFPAAGEFNSFGVKNSATGHSILLGKHSDVSTTRWYLNVNDVSGTDSFILGPAIDTNRHTVIFAFDGTILRVLFDGIVFITATKGVELLHMPITSVALASNNTMNLPFYFYQMAWRV
jgi:hypothetical protein